MLAREPGEAGPHILIFGGVHHVLRPGREQDVDILLRRADLERAKDAMQKAGFVYRRVAGLDAFLDKPIAKARKRGSYYLCR